MNIFEQYGIKEVADVTLYAIALDKYDNEVYIPVIYFDTLKVSTVEQSAEQTSARGGLGNSELIIWDYGKEITVTLEDALYTPASQSLMWGSKFNLGKFKILGAFFPRETDINFEISDGQEFLCWGDQKEKQIEGAEAGEEGIYPHYVTLPHDEGEDKLYYIRNVQKAYQDKRITEKMPECAELIIDDFEDFKIIYGNNGKINYCWLDVTLKLISYKDTQKVYIFDKNTNKNIDHLNIICTVENDNSTQFTILFNYEDLSNVSPTYKINYNNDLSSWVGIKQSYAFTLPSNRYYEKQKIIQFEVGKFCIIQDRNWTDFNLKDLIYPIDYGIENATQLDRIEKCTAKKDFVFDADKNLRAYNCSQLNQYKNSKINYFINPMTMKPFEANSTEFINENGDQVIGNLVLIKKDQVYYKWIRDIARPHQSLGRVITVDSTTFPGNFKLVGNTYSRRRSDGKDERFQFEIPLCKIKTSNSLNFAAAGDPTTYTFSLRVLRGPSGEMMKLTQYEVDYDCATDSNTIIQVDELGRKEKCCLTEKDMIPSQGTKTIIDPKVNNCYKDWLPHRGCSWVVPKELVSITIVNPIDNMYQTPLDESIPYEGRQPYLAIPVDSAAAQSGRNINDLIIELHFNDNTMEYLTQQNQNKYNITWNFNEGDSQ